MKTLVSDVAAALVVILLSCPMAASGEGDVLLRVNGDNRFQIGEANTVEVWIKNDVVLQGMTIALEFSGDLQFELQADHGNHGYVAELGDAVDVWDYLGGLTIAASADGQSPDSVLIGGLSSSGGLPAHPDHALCYSLGVYIPPGQSTEISALCIDNIFYPPGGDWLFVEAGGPYVPDFCGFFSESGGNPSAPPVCFEVCQGSNCGRCCVGPMRGDANGSGDDKPTIGDISVLIDAKFISGDCGANLQPPVELIPCYTEADVNESSLGPGEETCDDISIGDISLLIDYLFISGPEHWDQGYGVGMLAPCP